MHFYHFLKIVGEEILKILKIPILSKKTTKNTENFESFDKHLKLPIISKILVYQNFRIHLKFPIVQNNALLCGPKSEGPSTDSCTYYT